MERRQDDKTLPVPGSVFVTINEQNKVVKAEINIDEFGIFTDFVNKNVQTLQAKGEIPNH